VSRHCSLPLHLAVCFTLLGGCANEPAMSNEPVATVGPAIENEDQWGSGPCTGKRVRDVVAAIHSASPELADIATIYRKVPLRLGDGSYIYVFGAPDGGWRLIFKRGSYDCPATCGDNEYFYFATDEMCVARMVGYYHNRFDGQRVGQRVWNFP
jgi:hypothetical protein